MTVGSGLNPRPKNWFTRFFSPSIEESLRLRVLVLASLWLGALGLAWAGGDLRLALLGSGLGTLGYWLSWRWRHQRSLVRPLLIATAVIALSFYMRSQMLEVFNGNWLPVGHFLVLVQAFSSFESRTRGGLYAGLVLSGSVLFFASQQAFEPSFGIFVVGFLVVLLAFLTMAFLEDGIRGARVHWAQHSLGRSGMLPYWIGVACAVFILSGLAFWIMPRGELSLAGAAQLAVVPYSGESLGEGYHAPQVNLVDLATIYPSEYMDGQAQKRAAEDANNQALNGSGTGFRDGGGAALPPSEATSGSFAESSKPTEHALLYAAGAAPPGSAGGDTVFFVRTKVTSYWRGRTLEHFLGETWRTDISPKYLVPSTTKPGEWYDRDNLNRGSGPLYQQTFYVQGEDLDAIITGYRSLNIKTLDGSLNRAGVERGTTYQVLSAYPEHDANGLRRDSTWVAGRHLVSIPTTFGGELLLLAGRIIDGAASDFEKIERIVSYLRQEGKFNPGWPENPTATAQLDNFLIQGQPGNAMDYATATVMLARASRLPARLAVGYLPGTRDSLSGAYKVRNDDAHAWAEIYFADHGRVPFDSSPRGDLVSQGRSGSRVGFMFQAGAGNAVFGAVKSAPSQFFGVVMEALRNPILSITVPVVLLIGLVLRWVYARPGKGATCRKAALAYQDKLSGEDRRQLLSLYGQLERLLRRKSGSSRKSWQTVTGFTRLATGADPLVESQVTWFNRAVWRAAYDPGQLPAGLVEDARERLRRIRRSLKTIRAAPIRRA